MSQISSTFATESSSQGPLDIRAGVIASIVGGIFLVLTTGMFVFVCFS